MNAAMLQILKDQLYATQIQCGVTIQMIQALQGSDGPGTSSEDKKEEPAKPKGSAFFNQEPAVEDLRARIGHKQP